MMHFVLGVTALRWHSVSAILSMLKSRYCGAGVIRTFAAGAASVIACVIVPPNLGWYIDDMRIVLMTGDWLTLRKRTVTMFIYSFVLRPAARITFDTPAAMPLFRYSTATALRHASLRTTVAYR